MVLTIDITFEKALHDKDSQKYMIFERDVIEMVGALCIPILFVYYWLTRETFTAAFKVIIVLLGFFASYKSDFSKAWSSYVVNISDFR